MEREPVTPPIIEKIPKPVEKDEDWEDDSEDISCDKGSHKERSIANQPNHLIFWRKHKEEDGEA